MVPSNHSFIPYCDFSILLLVKLSLSILFASFLVSVFCFLFDDGSLFKVIALATIAIAIVVALSRDKSVKERKRATFIAVAIVGRAITICEAIQKRSHETI
jgi:Kef-type K+ transport system membrane component KefB